jgi:RNA polymerase sigma-70 factor (ECF subfamily)
VTSPVTEESHRENPPPTIENPDFSPLLRELMPELLRYFGRRVPSAEDAADCLGETMIVLWRRREAVPLEREPARRYAYGVAANVLRESQRGRARQFALTERLVADYDITRDGVVEGDADSDLNRALSTLRPLDRELVLLVAWEGFGVGEAGAVLGLSDQASRARYSRARARLRRSLASPGDD